jgi:formylglycine-generating enzyme required for sulfatase activity
MTKLIKLSRAVRSATIATTPGALTVTATPQVLAAAMWVFVAPGREAIMTKAIKGGSFNNNRDYTRCAYRVYNTPGGRDLDVGFRCARIKDK